MNGVSSLPFQTQTVYVYASFKQYYQINVYNQNTDTEKRE